MDILPAYGSSRSSLESEGAPVVLVGVDLPFLQIVRLLFKWIFAGLLVSAVFFAVGFLGFMAVLPRR